MNMQEYIDMKNGYIEFDDEMMRRALRQHAFEEFDAQVEAFCGNGRERDNGGRSILDVSRQEVERILDRYVERFGDEGSWARDDWMRNAIQDVTGLVC